MPINGLKGYQKLQRELSTILVQFISPQSNKNIRSRKVAKYKAYLQFIQMIGFENSSFAIYQKKSTQIIAEMSSKPISL